MNLLSSIFLLHSSTTLAFAQSAPQPTPASLPNQPGALVRCLYTDVVARHPIGIPADANREIFVPYLSKAMMQRIDIAVVCAADYDRQYPDPNLKQPFIWLEAGFFRVTTNEPSHGLSRLKEHNQRGMASFKCM